MTVSLSSGSFKEGDLLTCTSDGYPQPSYSWTDADGVVVSTTSEVALPRGVFNLTCTATGNFTTPCSAKATITGFATEMHTKLNDTKLGKIVRYALTLLQG